MLVLLGQYSNCDDRWRSLLIASCAGRFRHLLARAPFLGVIEGPRPGTFTEKYSLLYFSASALTPPWHFAEGPTHRGER